MQGGGAAPLVLLAAGGTGRFFRVKERLNANQTCKAVWSACDDL